MLMRDICCFKNGKSFKGLNNGNIPLIGSTGKLGLVDRALIDSPCCIIARVGANCGFVQYIDYPCWVSDNAIICTSNKANIKYLYYKLLNTNINLLKTGGAQPLITLEILESIVVNIHDLPTQQHIVDTIY